MKSTPSNSSLNWNSPLDSLFKRGLTKNAQKIYDSGIQELSDLLWIFPNKIFLSPVISKFSLMSDEQLFKGIGKIVGFQSRPNFWAKGKGRVPLQNITLTVQDCYSSETINLKWFNSYPSVANKLQKLEFIVFQGKVSIYKDSFQIANPDYQEIEQEHIPRLNEINSEDRELNVVYPTINGVSNSHIKNIIERIPFSLWDQISETLPAKIIKERDLLSLSESFKILHGKVDNWSEDLLDRAKKRIIYQEFFNEQIKVFLRKDKVVHSPSIYIEVDEIKVNELKEIFPYELTDDQSKAIDDIVDDFSTPGPMMRMIQGDVGCGKTSIAIISALLSVESGYQAALMCPTEALAYQHFSNIKELLHNFNYKIEILLGSTPNKEKKLINEKLKKGEIDFIVGTHSLIQDSVDFKSLALAIIDEQHKFGVNQRLKLIQKTQGCHCLIMTATPIPRSLSLTQYGDLDLSIIKTMPSTRKGHKTRIVTPDTFSKYLSFVKTRLSMGEQAYIVVPAIEESETLDIENLESVLEDYKKLFNEYRVEGLHGKIKSSEKQEIFNRFANHEIDLLISTSVIEVGINVLNATVMAILNPERFGLSSLHQLRGRVGRGSKQGFCFLVNNKEISPDQMRRLQIIENSTDGFKIAEEDLKIRGEGDLFGTNQSGDIQSRRLANIVLHQDQLFMAQEDLKSLLKDKQINQLINIQSLTNKEHIFHTI